MQLTTHFSSFKGIDEKVFDYDLEQAKTLLDEVGWQLPAGQQIRQKDGQPLTLDLSFNLFQVEFPAPWGVRI